MIELSIKNQKKPEVEKEFKGVVYLEQQENGDIALRMEDNDDEFEAWYVATLKTDGTFKRISDLPSNIGLQVDSDGRIIEGDSDDS